MSKPDLTREAVLKALARFDELGRNVFLDKYGFERSKAYFVVHDGAYYDSKAIAGVAHGLANPRAGPLRAKEFSGGKATVQRWLKEVGFEVVKLPGGRIFGEIGGHPPGTGFVNRLALAASGVHRPLEAGICGSDKDGGAESIVVSGGYEDDQDDGDLILYTGHGGQKRGVRTQTADQELTRQNLALAHNIDTGLPVRVVRGAGASAHAPKTGFRYDGLFRVEKYWAEKGKSGFRVYRYQLRKMAADEARAYTPISNLGPGRENPQRRQHSTTRVVRDTQVSRGVKALHKHRCQVCGVRLKTPTGEYAEAAHIHPLGEPHNGPDTPENVLCLCPNHHVLFDRGAFAIADDMKFLGLRGQLRTERGHRVHRDRLRYHRGLYGFD